MFIENTAIVNEKLNKREKKLTKNSAKNMNFSNWSWSNWKGRKTKITSSHCFTTKTTKIDHFKNNTNDIHWNICNKILS